MRKLLNTLYVTTANAYLGCERENVVIYIEDEIKFRVPVHNIESIITFGYAGASPALMHLCASRGVALSFLSPNGRFIGRLGNPVTGNVLLRKKQYSLYDNEEESFKLGRNFILGKLMNSRTVLRRFLRDHKESSNVEDVSDAADIMATHIEKLLNSDNIAVARGIEGWAARTYFGVFNYLILDLSNDFIFQGRSRRPPLDRTNAMLSFLYSILAHDCAAALETVGLDPQVGFLHKIRPGRLSLALDLMEELRPYLVDRLTLTLINTNQINGKHFVIKESGGVIMTDEGRKIIIDAWQTRKQQELIHPYLEERIEVGLIPYIQAMLLARCIRGDIDGYPPYLVR